MLFFFLKSVLAASHKFSYVVLSFSLNLKCFLIPFLMSSVIHELLRSVLFISQKLWIFRSFKNLLLIYGSVIEYTLDYFNLP